MVYRKAYGNRALVPLKEPMTVDTIFDIASLTKIVATTSGMMKLFEQGKVRIDDPVTAYLPEFQGGQSPITVRDLMTHFSGLPPDLDLEPAWSGYETGIQQALADKPASPPEAKFVYSDINFILLGEIVHRLSGMPENEYVKQILFDPLGMNDTRLSARADRIAADRAHRNAEGRDDPARRGARSDRALHGRSRRPCRSFLHCRRSGKFCQMILDGGDGLFSPGDHPEIHVLRIHRSDSRFCAASAGISIRRTREIAANCFRSARSATRALPAPRSGSIRFADLCDPSGEFRASAPAQSRSRRCAARSPPSSRRPIGYEAPVGNADSTAAQDTLTGLDVLEQANFGASAGETGRADHESDRHRPPGTPQCRRDEDSRRRT